MTGPPAHPAGKCELALVAAHHLHARGLAHDAGGGAHRQAFEVGEQPAHADAADFLVVGERQMDRCDERCARELGYEGQGDGDETFHVAGPAAVEPIVGLGQIEGVAAPGLAVDGHHVRMTGERDAGLVRGPDGGVEVALAPLSSWTRRASMPWPAR